MDDEDDDDAFQVITLDDVDYLVDMESFIVTTVEDDVEVGTWDDESESILFFANMAADGEPEPEPEPEP
eukprot:COSAG06_NODE_31808_length_515_cov_0.978365_1_plen_68_part_01